MGKQDIGLLRGLAEHVPRDHMHGPAHDHGHVDALLGEVECDLGARVAATDHERAFAQVGRGILVLRGVDGRAAKALQPGQRGQVRHAVVARGHDDKARRHHAGARLHLEAVSLALHPVHGRAQARRHLVLGRIGLQVLDHLLARRVARRGLRPGLHRQAGVGLGRVQMQPVIVLAPGRADGPLAFQHHMGQTLLAQAGRGGEAGADDENIFRVHGANSLFSGPPAARAPRTPVLRRGCARQAA